MPVVVVAMAASSFAAGVTAFAAATTLAGAVAAGAMVVGGALTIVGTITKNQKLTKIGGILSLAGGIGTMAVNAANAGSAVAGEAAGEVAGEAAAGAAGDAAAGAAAGAGEAATSAITEGVSTQAVDLGMGAVENVATAAPSGIESIAPSAANVAPVAQSQGMLGDAVAKISQPMQTAGTGTLSTAGTEVGQATAGQAFDTGAGNSFIAPSPNADMGMTQMNAQMGAGAAPGGDIGMMAKFEAWQKANPQTAKLLLDGSKGMLNTLATSAKDKQMIDYYNANTDAIKRRKLWGSGKLA